MLDKVTKNGQTFWKLLEGGGRGRNASCGHAGGLSCWYFNLTRDNTFQGCKRQATSQRSCCKRKVLLKPMWWEKLVLVSCVGKSEKDPHQFSSTQPVCFPTCLPAHYGDKSSREGLMYVMPRNKVISRPNHCHPAAWKLAIANIIIICFY